MTREEYRKAYSASLARLKKIVVSRKFDPETEGAYRYEVALQQSLDEVASKGFDDEQITHPANPKPCRCDYSCFLQKDQWWYKRNFKLIERITRLGLYAFAQNEVQRLHEKGSWMKSLGIESVDDIECKKHGEIES